MNQFSHSSLETLPISLKNYFSSDLTPYMSHLEFSPNDIIFHMNELPSSLLLLYKGTAKIYISQANAKMPLVHLIHAPNYIGALEFMEVQQTSEEVRAITTCHCLVLSVDKCRSILLKDAVFLHQLCRLIGKKSTLDTALYAYNQSYPLENRLALFILHHLHNGLYTARQMDAAEYLGTSYRHLLYVMAHFIERGLIKKTPYGYSIENSAALHELANI